MKRDRKEPERIQVERLEAEKRMEAARVPVDERERNRAWEELKANGATKVSAAKSATDYR